MTDPFEIIETRERVFADNEAAARTTRERMRENGTYFINVMGSPGAGKTSVLLNLFPKLMPQYRIGVMEADVDSDVDAKTVADAGAKVIQLHTGGLCHMDADMTMRGLDALGLQDLDLVFLENIGNLVCPAEFDTGADLKLLIFSVPEGDDKPLKYPLMFETVDLILVNKIDTAPVFDFDMERFKENVATRNKKAAVFSVSAKEGQGFEAPVRFLAERISGRTEDRA